MKLGWDDFIEFVVSEVSEKEFAINETIKKLHAILNAETGFCFVKHPLFSSINIDSSTIYIIVKDLGSVIIDVFDFQTTNISNIIDGKWLFGNWDVAELEIFEEASDKISLLESKILSNRDLRKYAEKDDRIKGSYALYLPNISRSLWEDEFAELFNDTHIFRKIGSGIK